MIYNYTVSIQQGILFMHLPIARNIRELNTSNIIREATRNQSYKYSPHYPFIRTQEITWKHIWEKPPRCSSSGMRKVTAPSSLRDAD